MRKARAGVAMPDLDLFGQAPVVIARKSNSGRPRVALRIMIALLYLKHAFNESDEGVLERWARPRLGSSSRDRPTLNTAGPVTPAPWSSLANSWATKA